MGLMNISGSSSSADLQPGETGSRTKEGSREGRRKQSRWRLVSECQLTECCQGGSNYIIVIDDNKLM